MSGRAAVVAIGALSPLGRGLSAYDVTAVGSPARVAIQRDEALVAAGLARPFAARVPSSTGYASAVPRDPATDLLVAALDDALASPALSPLSDRWSRVGFVVGTSSGGMRSAEELFARLARGEEADAELHRRATYFAPFQDAREHLTSRGVRVVRSVQLVTACAASTWAIGVGLDWLESRAVDLVLAGGYDALGPFVAAGFESLRATTATRPSPFRVGRDGMSLGEGAGIVAMVRAVDADAVPVHFFVSGFGASTDAVHVTAPDRTGSGLARAGRAALDAAGVSPGADVLVSAHGTATPFNDAMESRAISALFGDDAPVVHPMKAEIGHTLGAAGVLEATAIGHALSVGVAPAAAGNGPLDADAPARLLDRAEPLRARAALKLSAAFGGANAALVLEPTGAQPRRAPTSRRVVHLRATAAATAVDLERIAVATGADRDKVSRFDELSSLAATAAAALAPAVPRGAGVIVGHSLATVDINQRFYSRVLARGPTHAEPRLFPPTSPNLVPGQLAILFGWTGPSAAVASGPGGASGALSLAVDLVASSAADAMAVVAVDVVGSAARAIIDRAFPEHAALASGAVACWVSAETGPGAVEIEPRALGEAGFGHADLAKLLGSLLASP